MVSRFSGHYVQVWKPIGPHWTAFTRPRPRGPRHANAHPNYVEVEGRVIQRTVAEYPSYALDGWFYVSRELPRRRAQFYAKAYKRAGFKSRVIFRGTPGGGGGRETMVTDEYNP